MRLAVELGLELLAGAAGAGALRAAGLRHEAVDHAVKHDAVVESLAHQLLDAGDVAGREIGAHRDHDLPLVVSRSAVSRSFQPWSGSLLIAPVDERHDFGGPSQRVASASRSARRAGIDGGDHGALIDAFVYRQGFGDIGEAARRERARPGRTSSDHDEFMPGRAWASGMIGAPADLHSRRDSRGVLAAAAACSGRGPPRGV